MKHKNTYIIHWRFKKHGLQKFKNKAISMHNYEIKINATSGWRAVLEAKEIVSKRLKDEFPDIDEILSRNIIFTCSPPLPSPESPLGEVSSLGEVSRLRPT